MLAKYFKSLKIYLSTYFWSGVMLPDDQAVERRALVGPREA